MVRAQAPHRGGEGSSTAAVLRHQHTCLPLVLCAAAAACCRWLQGTQPNAVWGSDKTPETKQNADRDD